MANQTTHVIDTIIERIDQGIYLPGCVLDESGLSNELEVSRTPVREAFIRLEADGLIVRGGRRGAHVFKPTTDEFFQILEVHAQLESKSAELAARRLTEQAAAALERNVIQSQRHLDEYGDTEPARYYELNMQFHQIIFEAAANPYLTALIKTNARKLMAYYRNRYSFVGATQASVEDHQKLAALIQSRDSDGARAAMIEHFEYDLKTVMDLLAAVS